MKLVVGFPWYTGPDDNTFPAYFDMMMYFGALRERSMWVDSLDDEDVEKALDKLPSLDETSYDKGLSDPTLEEWRKLGKLEIILVNHSRTSLVGLAREMIVDTAVDLKADYLFWWDDDMRFEKDAFLRLWRHQKPVISALAFTARDPIFPVIFRLTEKWDMANKNKIVEKSEIVLDYPKDQLIGSADLGGDLALGAAVCLYDMNIFKQIPKPWFMSTGCGEDYFFSYRCKEFGVERWMDTSVKTAHVHHTVRWCDEEFYLNSRKEFSDTYEKEFGAVAEYQGMPVGNNIGGLS
tara:strand:- start:1040 stop:1918 length:879 start_codon:yes stop_codon:yes gene_type:complete